MAMANMNLIGVFVTKLWPEQALAYGGGDGGATKNIISQTFSNFGDIITHIRIYVIRTVFICVTCMINCGKERLYRKSILQISHSNISTQMLDTKLTRCQVTDINTM